MSPFSLRGQDTVYMAAMIALQILCMCTPSTLTFCVPTRWLESQAISFSLLFLMQPVSRTSFPGTLETAKKLIAGFFDIGGLYE